MRISVYKERAWDIDQEQMGRGHNDRAPKMVGLITVLDTTSFINRLIQGDIHRKEWCVHPVRFLKPLLQFLCGSSGTPILTHTHFAASRAFKSIQEQFFWGSEGTVDCGCTIHGWWHDPLMFVVGKYNVRPITGKKILRGNLTVMKIIVIILAVFIFLLRFKVVGNNQIVTCHIHGIHKVVPQL